MQNHKDQLIRKKSRARSGLIFVVKISKTKESFKEKTIELLHRNSLLLTLRQTNYTGQYPDLTENGIAQAKALAQDLITAVPHDLKKCMMLILGLKMEVFLNQKSKYVAGLSVLFLTHIVCYKSNPTSVSWPFLILR